MQVKVGGHMIEDIRDGFHFTGEPTRSYDGDILRPELDFDPGNETLDLCGSTDEDT